MRLILHPTAVRACPQERKKSKQPNSSELRGKGQTRLLLLCRAKNSNTLALALSQGLEKCACVVLAKGVQVERTMINDKISNGDMGSAW